MVYTQQRKYKPSAILIRLRRSPNCLTKFSQNFIKIQQSVEDFKNKANR